MPVEKTTRTEDGENETIVRESERDARDIPGMPENVEGTVHMREEVTRPKQAPQTSHTVKRENGMASKILGVLLLVAVLVSGYLAYQNYSGKAAATAAPAATTVPVVVPAAKPRKKEKLITVPSSKDDEIIIIKKLTEKAYIKVETARINVEIEKAKAEQAKAEAEARARADAAEAAKLNMKAFLDREALLRHQVLRARRSSEQAVDAAKAAQAAACRQRVTVNVTVPSEPKVEVLPPPKSSTPTTPKKETPKSVVTRRYVPCCGS